MTTIRSLTTTTRQGARSSAAAGLVALFIAAGMARALGQEAAPALPRIVLSANRSMVLTTEYDVTRIAVTNPAVADATVVQPREVLIDGKAAGTVTLLVWGASQRQQYDIVVDPGVSTLEQRLRALYPGEDISVSANDEALLLTGRVSSNAISLQAAEIAQATTSKMKAVNLLQLPGGSESQQVMLQVRFAEVSRQALRELGASFFTSALGIHDNVARVTTERFSAPGFSGLTAVKDANGNVVSSSGELTFGDFLNLFLFNTRYDIGAAVRALQNRGLLQSLAEPNLIAYNGQEAGFLAGGEIPVPVVQGGTSNAVSIQFKEYGVRLNFKPTIAGDTIRLRVRPEVSTLDFPNGITLGGFRVPALATRRAETDVELRDGQSFAIAGLMNNLSQDFTDEIPGLARLPIIGHLFQTKSTTATRNELMVLITPRLVRPLNPDEVPPLPTMDDRFLPSGDGGVSERLKGGAGAVDAPSVENTKGEKAVAKGKSQ